VQQGVSLKTQAFLLPQAGYTFHALYKKLTIKKQKNFSEKQKGFRDGLSYSTPQKCEETRGNAITQPQSHPIPKFYIYLMGWDRGWLMAFPLVSSLFEG